ncbi:MULTISPECIES: thioredoxin [unclassified Paenibacillus]|uniref:thioredoxin n=1 Tax=unclassified Paenibacillus TaxID=185978 RepID=UPI001EFFBFE3|nr:thioredoxin [Paenibacillus sp. JJ-223]CAH1210582.1 Thioredoxin [Paenibacillus sp. JJ-223]
MGATALNKDTFEPTIQSGVTLVDFWAPWCGPCQVQLPIVHELADELAEQATMATVNIDEELDLASKYGVRSIPTLLLFKDGKLMKTMVGITSKQVLKDRIKELGA